MNDLKQFILENCFRVNDTLRSEISNKDWWIKKSAVNFYGEILHLTSFLDCDATWAERIYCILTDIEINCRKVCKCGKIVSWSSPHSRYNYFCSPKCSSVYTLKKREDIFKTKYGVSNPAKTQIVKDKISHSFKKYTNGHPLRDDTIIEKRNKTCNERYGANTPLQSTSVLKKVAESIKNKYGVDKPLQNSDILEKQKNTTLLRHGVENFNQKHLSDSTLKKRKSLDEKSNLLDFFDLEYSKSHIYKIIKQKGIELEKNRSAGEIEVQHFLEKMLQRSLVSNIKMDGIEFDIYDSVNRVAIEFDGVFWHSENNGKNKNYHLNKTQIAQSNQIRLIHIFSSEWETKRDIVKSRLCDIFGVSKNRIFARKCVVKTLEPSQERDFFNLNHIQGYIPSKICYGLFYDNELVSSMSFSKPRFRKDVQWELLRYSSKINLSVVGAASKMLTAFRKNNTGSIVSYADRRWSQGNVYKKLGFLQIGESPPGFFYTKNGMLESRLKYQKHKLKRFVEYDESMSADDIMIKMGYSKIWDCGNLVFKL